MDYIDRRLRRLHADNLFWEREYRRALSRTWILRDRLAHIPPTMLDGIEGVASAASTLSAVADRAARLRRRAADARNRLAVFDPERQHAFDRYLLGMRCARYAVFGMWIIAFAIVGLLVWTVVS